MKSQWRQTAKRPLIGAAHHSAANHLRSVGYRGAHAIAIASLSCRRIDQTESATMTVAVPSITAAPIQKVRVIPPVSTAPTMAAVTKTTVKKSIANAARMDGSALKAATPAATAAVDASKKRIEN